MRLVQLGILAVGLIGVVVVASEPSARSRGQLDRLLMQFDLQLERGLSADDPSLAPLRRQIDHAAQQKDAHLSRLYWHTDLSEALSEAKRLNRPVLSLRLLGKLDEEYSCANSRFFRAVLYADPEISALLRDQFVLHWESVRPVPIMTIDFGDGRTIKRTVTGNSIHYILSPSGQIVDALPGLIAPRVFQRELADVVKLDWNAQAISAYQHRKADLGWGMKFDQADFALPPAILAWIKAQMPPVNPRFIPARAAGERAPSKIQIEQPMLKMALSPLPALSTDTRINMTQFRPTILAWLIQAPATDLRSLNDRVYRDLFLTPLDDPWMGLDTPDLFSGLPSARTDAAR
jgi:hypothetical protein